VVQFHRILPGAIAPQRADRAAGGLIPTRAFRYCEAMCSASAFGWYLFPPMEFSLLWDGHDTVWSMDGHRTWHNLNAVQYPDFYEQFNALCPESLIDQVPPMIGATNDPGIINLWTGLIARTRDDWSLLIRPPANLPRSGKYDGFEGIVETDRWFGPLFTNIKLTRTDVPIDFYQDVPFAQVQPIHRSLYQQDVLDSYAITDSIEDLSNQDWADYHETMVAPGLVHEREKGAYAKKTRKRKKRPVT